MDVSGAGSVSGAGTFSVRDTKHASWPWSKQPLTAKGVRLGYLILCTVFGIAFLRWVG